METFQIFYINTLMGIKYMSRFTNKYTVLSTSFIYNKYFNTSKIDLKFV
jgi:hypothetical protein